jgi:hypothetical protein
MANLKPMPTIILPVDRLVEIGKHWNDKVSELPKSKGELVGKLCDETVGNALATMLGGISVEKPKMNQQARTVLNLGRPVSLVEFARRISMLPIGLTVFGSPTIARRLTG